VGGPGGVAQLVADGYGEAPIVGPHQADHRPLLALNVQVRALAAVLGPPLSRSWKIRFL
jgi:hypothetical protein